MDGNPFTEADPDWAPLGAPGGGLVPDFTPPFPAYIAGHSALGAAAFGILADFYGTDDVSFTIGSDELPGVFRAFDSFSAAAEENGLSRIYLGVHWSFDDTLGLTAGNQVADWTFANELQPVPEPSTFALFSIGILGLLGYSWQRQKQGCEETARTKCLLAPVNCPTPTFPCFVASAAPPQLRRIGQIVRVERK